MKNRWLIILLIFSVAINLAAVATMLWQYWYLPPPEDRLPPPLPKAFELPPHERELLRENYLDFFERTSRHQQKIERIRQRLFDCLVATEIDTNLINRQLDSLAGVQKEIQKQIIFNLLEQRKVLDQQSFQRVLHQFQNRFMKPYPPREHGPRGQFRRFRNRPGMNYRND